MPALDSRPLLERALAAHPALAAAAARRAAAQDGVLQARDAWWPRLDGQAMWGYASDGFGAGSGDYTVGVNLIWELFAPGRIERQRQARAGLEQAEAELQGQAGKIRLAVLTALADLDSARAQLEVARTAEARADRALQIVRERNTVGLATVTDLLRAQSDRNDADQRLRLARHGMVLAHARALLAAGQLDSVAPLSQALGGVP